jgi:DNA-binding NtrC family response regulator
MARIGRLRLRQGAEFSRRVMKNFTVLRVLIVDDESLIRWSIAETLTQAGYEVTEAATAAEALQRVSTRPSPDVVFLDYRLPDSSDLRLLESIRRSLPHTPVIMMTAYGTPAVAAGAEALGSYRVLTKPVEMRDVAPLVEQAYASRLQ